MTEKIEYKWWGSPGRGDYHIELNNLTEEQRNTIHDFVEIWNKRRGYE